MSQAILFDGDDTLWRTEPLYDEARQEARRLVEATGVDGAEWEALERELDVENVERLGHRLVRFPTSCVEAYQQLCQRDDRVADSDVASAIWDTASSVFERPAPLVPRAREVLEALHGRGLHLALLTKGDRDLQQRRVEQSGLAHLFDVVEIVDEKTPEAFAHVLQVLNLPAGSALSVGNSVRSDVLPSLAAGIQPVWIDAHVWEYERSSEAVDERVIQIAELGELTEVV